MAMKRNVIDEFYLSEVKESASATVHGIVTELSPLKKSKKDDKIHYFNGHLSDGKTSLRLVSFEPSLRQAMNNSLSSQDAIAVVGCQIRPGRSGVSEVLLNKETKIEESPKNAISLHSNDQRSQPQFSSIS